MNGRENEETERYEDSAEADHLAEVTSIQKPPNRIGKQQNEETLRAADQIQLQLVDCS